MRERIRLQLSCRALHTILPFTATEMRNKPKEWRPGTGKERARGGNNRE
jgi:hypothetical protein